VGGDDPSGVAAQTARGYDRAMAEPALHSIRQVSSHQIDGRPVNAAMLAVEVGCTRPSLWQACTDPGLLARWFVPVSGELRVGGHFALEGNASGTIERCDPPRGFFASWEFGDSHNWIAVRLTTVGTRATRLELEHLIPTADEIWDGYGPGAVGVGWELALVGLTRYLDGLGPLGGDDAEPWPTTEAGHRFVSAASAGWAQAAREAGSTDADAERLWALRTTAFYTGATLPDET
jgi:uncharacterized protein YndB with AHSA1/START domain